MLNEKQVTLFGITPEENPELAQIQNLLNSHQVNYRLINILEGSMVDIDFKNTLNQMCGINTIPAIFVGFKYIGGIDELKML